MLSRSSININDLTHIHVVGRSIVRNGFCWQASSRIVDFTDFLFLTFFDTLRNRVDRSRNVVDITDRTIWRYSKAVLVVKTICLNLVAKFSPVSSTWDKDIFEEFFNAVWFWNKLACNILVKVASLSIVWFFKVVEGDTTFTRNIVWLNQGPVVHEHEVDACKFNRLRRSIFNQLLGKVAVKSHGTKTKGVSLAISMVDSRNSYDVWTICNESKGANHSTDRTTKVRWSHHVDHVGWTKVTWYVCSHLKKFLSIVDQAWFLNLKNLRAQVTHDNLTINRICTVSRINVDDIRVARLLLQFRDFSFQITRLDFCLTDVWICDQFIVFFSDVDVVEWHTVFFFYRVRAEEIHFFIFTSQFVEFIWYYDTEWEGLYTNFFISIFFLSWKKGDDIWVKDVEVDNTSTLTLPQLVRVREAVFEEFHNWYDPRSCSFITFDRCTSFTKVAEGNSHTTTDTWKLKSWVDRTSDRVHIISYLD